MKHAFSLVELSIVLVILGLLTGGILGGQSLIAAASLRAQLRQFDQIQTSLNQFRDKYFSMPGDMGKATSFWPSTNNGDGNGTINWRTTINDNRPGYFGWEYGLYWQHLALAGLIEGSYPNTWIVTGVSVSPVVGVDVPLMKLNNNSLGVAGPTIDYADPYYQMNGPLDGTLVLYSLNNALAGVSPMIERGVAKPETVWNMDTKIDDGRPQTGTLRARGTRGGGDSYQCMKNDAATLDGYNLSWQGAACGFSLKLI